MQEPEPSSLQVMTSIIAVFDRAPPFGSGLAVGDYLRLDALTSPDHAKCVWKVLKRKSGCEHHPCINRAAAQEIDRRPKGVEDRHRAKQRDLVIVDAERRERNPCLAGCNAEDHKLAAALDRCESSFNGPCNACDIDHTIKSKRLVFKHFVDVNLYVGGP